MKEKRWRDSDYFLTDLCFVLLAGGACALCLSLSLCILAGLLKAMGPW